MSYRRIAAAWMLMSVCLMPRSVWGEAWQKWMSPEAFEQFSIRASRRVELFQQVWRVDPTAKIFGGTVRDFLWFLRRELASARSASESSATVTRLSGRTIEAQEFIPALSDVDVISSEAMTSVLTDNGHISRIETQPPSRFVPGGQGYEDELTQGSVPIEKLLLGADGFADPEGLSYRAGLAEIYAAKPSVRFDARVVATDRYRNHGNHPVLLVLRYLRQVARAVAALHGNTFIENSVVLSALDLGSASSCQQVVSELLRRPEQLNPFLANPHFLRRFLRKVTDVLR